MYKPLADRVRPGDILNMVGQQHLLANGKILNRILQSGNIPNMIFYGPSGTGKTTLANIIAKATNKTFYKLNATTASVSDIKNIVSNIDTLLTPNGILLYLDEIQNFNKKQQQSLLEFIESGKIILIASTTENPYFYVYNAILSRSNVFEFKPLETSDIINALKRVMLSEYKELNYDEPALQFIAQLSGGDLRKSLNILEIISESFLYQDKQKKITLDIVKECTSTKHLNYDRDGDSHYDLLSAFQKSIRGSDPNASIHYLARLIKGGDLISICRRLLVIASEDIGLAYPTAISIVKSCVDAAFQVGFPEARIMLSQAVIFLATAPKSNSAITAIDVALSDIEDNETGEIPSYLKDSHYNGAKILKRGDGYRYPHNFENNYVNQQYLPDKLKNKVYYIPGNNKLEQKILKHMEFLKSTLC